MFLFFFFHLVYKVNYTGRIMYVEPFLNLLNEVYVFMVDDLHDVFLDSVLIILLIVF